MCMSTVMEGKPCLKGLAPFASVEDLSDGESPPGKHRLALPGIKEDLAPGGPKGCAPPRIDISRASSSSHHDDSSPERELFAGNYLHQYMKRLRTTLIK